MMIKETIRSELAALERRLYSAGTPERELSDLSLRVSIMRERYARALKVRPWTATAALDSAAGDEEETEN